MQTPPTTMPALVTPFTTHGDLDEDAHRHNVALLAGNGVGGFVIAGSTGEGPYLEPGERERLASATRRELGAHTYVMCGIAAQSLRGARKQIGEAAAGGADAVLVMTPTLLVGGNEHLVARFYRDVTESCPLPLFLYTVPPVTGYELPVSIVVAQSKAAAGIKDSGGNPERIAEWHAQVTAPFFTFCGASRAVMASVAAGAHGAITASANYAADLVVSAVSGDSAAQAALTARAADVEAYGVAGTKAAAEAFGLRTGPPRRPLLPLASL